MKSRKTIKTLIGVVFIVIAAAVIISYCYYSFISFTSRSTSDLIANTALVILNLAASFFITTQISKFGFTESKKELAKSSIRHIRLSWQRIRFVDLMVSKKLSHDSRIGKRDLEEIHNHMICMLDEIHNMELDFKDLVNEEYKEEQHIMAELEAINEDMANEIEKSTEIDKEKLDEWKRKVMSKYQDLPFGTTPSYDWGIQPSSILGTQGVGTIMVGDEWSYCSVCGRPITHPINGMCPVCYAKSLTKPDE